MRRGLDEEKIVWVYVLVISQAVLMRQYQCFLAVIEVSNMVERGVTKYVL